MPVRETILKLINQETVICASITDNTDLYKDLYFDSLSYVCLLMDIEKQYSITIELSEMTDCHIVGQLIKLVERKVNKEIMVERNALSTSEFMSAEADMRYKND